MTETSEASGIPVVPEASAAGDAPPPAPLTPTSGEERIATIDIVRGVALFGILAANIRGFAGPAAAYFNPHIFWKGTPDVVAQAFVDTFIQGKFITIFAVLFGVGFAAQLTRAEKRGSKFGGVYAKRLFFLCLFGIAHGLFIWFGDILLMYGLIGYLLFFFKKRKDLTLTIWGSIGYFVPLILFTVVLIVTAATGSKLPTPEQGSAAALQKNVEIFANGSWSEIQQQRMKEVVGMNWGMFPVMFMNILAMFLFGLLAWRRGFFQPAAESLPRYRKWMMIGLTVGSVVSLTATALRWIFAINPFPPTPLALGIFAVQLVSTPALSLGYVCAIILLCHNPRWKERLRPFGAVGRTALTNYVSQSVIGTLLFYSYGLGLFGQYGPALLLIPTIAIYAAQVAISSWWLKRFRFGPLEWAWRSLTYGRLQPLVREERTAVAPVAA